MTSNSNRVYDFFTPKVQFFFKKKVNFHGALAA
jgi:hypothetical protein